MSISLIQSGISRLGGSIFVSGGKVSMSHSTRLDLVEEFFDSEEVRLCVTVVHTQIVNYTYQKDTSFYVIYIR